MKERPCKSGTYIIENIKKERFYLGSTKDFNKRKYNHWRLLKSNKHTNAYLQADWNKQSPEDFVFRILKRTPIDWVLHEEQILLDKFYDNQNRCYNFLHESWKHRRN